jgi:hypothetical protein
VCPSAAGDDRECERRKVLRRAAADGHPPGLIVAGQPDVEVDFPAKLRNPAANRDVSDFRARGEPGRHPAEEGFDPSRIVALLPEAERHGHQPVGVEARLEGAEVVQRADEEQGADQQRHRQS